jgi:hypothetical protein
VKPGTRFLLGQGQKLILGAVCLVGAIAVCRLFVRPEVLSALSLGENASSAVRRAVLFAAAVLSYGAFVRFYERRSVTELSFRRCTLVAAAAGALSIGLTVLFLYATGHYELVAFRGFDGTAGALVTIAIAAVFEELVFRALLFRILEETFGTSAALFGSAALFSVAHLTNNGVHAITPLTVTVAGLMWAGIFIVWRNVWVVAAHHACWNATIFLIGVPLSGENWQSQAPWETAVRGSDLWTGGSFGPEDSVLNIAVMALLCAALWWIGRRRGRWVTGPLRAACPAAHEAGLPGPRSPRPATPTSP